jgi:DNA-binding CsgD family transcriptional regulator
MNTYDLSDFSDMLLELYLLAKVLPIDSFQDAALNLLKPIVPFDSAIWGTAAMTDKGVDIHLMHLHRGTPEMAQAFELVKHEHPAGSWSVAREIAAEGVHSPAAFGASEYREFLRRFGHKNVFISQEVDLKTKVLHSISLYRSDKDAHCTPGERRIVETLRPHFMQALALNRARHLEKLAAPIPGLRQGLALANLRGVLYQADAQFDTLLREEWAGWQDGLLPLPFMDHLLSGKAEFLGRTLVLRGHAEHGLLFCRARPRCLADALTARERDIAGRVAQGQTYKEIAQDLSRSPATVRNQIQAIYTKLEVSNIAALIEAVRPLQ